MVDVYILIVITIGKEMNYTRAGAILHSWLMQFLDHCHCARVWRLPQGGTDTGLTSYHNAVSTGAQVIPGKGASSIAPLWEPGYRN